MGTNTDTGKTTPPITAIQAQNGPPVLPHQRVQLMSPEDWEAFIDEWANSLKPNIYKKVERHSSSGDMGIDICGLTDEFDPNAPWDNFQCKRYAKPLSFNEARLDIAKVIFYTWKNEYTTPRYYFFCATRDVGSSLARIFKRKGNELKEKLRVDWEKHCAEKITTLQKVELSGDFLDYFDAFNFDIFNYKPVADLIEQHRKTPYFVARFGGGLPGREAPLPPPPEIAPHETVYVRQLLDAYADYLKKPIPSATLIPTPALGTHFERSRREFYCAEGLRSFSMESLPPQEYSRLKDEMLSAISNIVDGAYSDGYTRVLDVVKHAQTVQIDSHPLKDRMNLSDRAGICHQLANENMVKWVKS